MCMGERYGAFRGTSRSFRPAEPEDGPYVIPCEQVANPFRESDGPLLRLRKSGS